ncbi:MAG TPA: MBL fold metallo-hydrolase, partial [bacterium]|nr:MBL fold metallo-hydrolase [bacterium]
MDDRVRKRWWLIVFMLLACLAVCIWMNAICPQTETLIVNVLDVGQGDAIFITAPDGKQILIDGGPDSSVLQELGEVMPPLDRSIDLVVLTHPDADHVTGLVPVLERYAVAMILEKHLPEHTTAVYNRWQELERSEGAELAEARTGMQIEITEEYRFETYVSDSIEDNVNNNSVVLKLMYQDDCLMLLTGDIEADEEAD